MTNISGQPVVYTRGGRPALDRVLEANRFDTSGFPDVEPALGHNLPSAKPVSPMEVLGRACGKAVRIFRGLLGR